MGAAQPPSLRCGQHTGDHGLLHVFIIIFSFVFTLLAKCTDFKGIVRYDFTHAFPM